MCALTFARRFRYNTSKHPRDGASAVADQVRWICGLVVQSGRIFGSFSRRSGMRLSNLDGWRGVSASSRGVFDLIHLVDSLERAEEIDRRARKWG